MRLRQWLVTGGVVGLGLRVVTSLTPDPDSGPGSKSAPATERLPAGVDTSIVEVIDGDTVVVRAGRGRERVRLIGLDSPETKDPRRPVECFGREASAFLGSMLPDGTAVRLVGDIDERDAYARLLAYVYRRADGLFINAELVRQGYAETLTIPPNHAHTAALAALAREAREAGRGLWAACEPRPP